MLSSKIADSNHSFLTKLLTLIGGTIGAYAFPIILSPILTRIYTPDEFLLFTIYFTIVQLASVISSFKYELAIPLVENFNEKMNLFKVCLINIVINVAMVSIFLELYAFYAKSISNIKYFVPSGIILISLLNHVLYNYLLSVKKFKYISVAKIIFGIIYSLFPIVLYEFMNLKSYVYIIAGHQIGMFVAIFSMYINLYSNNNTKNINHFYIKIKDIKTTYKKYKKYAIFSSPSQVLNHLGIWLPVIFIWLFFEQKYASLFFLSHRIVNFPILLLGHSIGKIFYSEASTLLNQGKLNEGVTKYFKILLYLAIPFLFICVFLAPTLFEFIFSNDWAFSGTIIKILSPWLFITFLAAPLSYIPTIYYKLEKEIVFHITLFIIRCISLYIGVLVNSVILALFFYSISNAFLWLIYLIIMLKMSDIKLSNLFVQCLAEKYEYIAVIMAILSIYMFIDEPIYIFIATTILLIFILINFIKKINKIKLYE